MKAKFFFLVASVFLGAIESQAQFFQSSITIPGKDFNHYSIETTEEGYVCAGTLFDQNTGNKDIHVLRLDPQGQILWEKTIDISQDDRALDVCIGPDNEIAITGHISPNGTNNQELYVARFNAGGTLLNDNKLNFGNTEELISAGTNIIYSSQNGEYVVGGFLSSPDWLHLPQPMLYHSWALVVRMDQSLGYIHHSNIQSTTFDLHTAVNDLVETPSGYFVVGSAGRAGNQHGNTTVLAVMVSPQSLNLVFDASFESTVFEHVGVSAVYDFATDEIFVLSNNSSAHDPQINVIDGNSGTLLNQYYLFLPAPITDPDAGGYQLMPSLKNSGNLVAVGYYRDYPNSFAGTSNNSTPWMIEFDKTNGSDQNTYLWPAPSPNFAQHGGGLFSTVFNQHPYIFNQEIVTTTPDGTQYALVGPRDINGSFGIDLISFDFSYPGVVFAEPLPCFTPENSTTGTPNTNRMLVEETYFTMQAQVGPIASAKQIVSFQEPPCSTSERMATDPLESKIETEDFFMQVSPNPFRDHININWTDEARSGKLTLVNAIGQEVYSSNILPGVANTLSISMERFQSGIYLLKFESQQEQKTWKLVKE